MFIRTQSNGSRTYLLMVDNERVNGKVKQRVLLRLGRLEELLANGQLDSLLQSLGRFSEKLAVLGAHAEGDSITTRSVRIGPALIFERLWQACSIDTVLTSLLKGRRFEFSVERAIFLTVLNRLFAPSSDRAAEKWKDDYAIRGVADLELQHLYRAMAWLGEVLAEDQQDGATPFAPRTNKDLIEEALFARRRDLFTDLEMVFFDTTSIYFEGQGGPTIGQHGHSKDHRPDLKQMVVGMVLDRKGNPVCSELWPGNTADVKSLVPIVERLQSRFGIGSVSIVADRGMISAETLAEVERRKWSYILGVRMRSSTEARAVVARAGRYAEVHPKSDDRDDPSPLKVKEVWVEDARRYVVCLNVDQATKDRHDREAVVASLRDALSKGDKSLVGNKGYRKYLRAGGKQFAVDEDKIKEEARYDGKWVLTTNMDLPASEVALKYKQLWMVEDVFRSMKSLLDTRPIYHKCDETIRGHVFCSFLALLLRKELDDRLARKRWKLEWADVICDLDNLVEMEVAIRGKSYVFRGQAPGVAAKVFQAVGVALPPVLRSC
ncbi:MAG: IS1634 family transposase [Terriglobia bacterium]|nr:IS1634 family transposase [Terriglobia bacterium]